MEFKVPELGENIAQGDVVKVLVREGQVIEPNQGVVELETDKAVIEIPCPQGGKVTKIHVHKGDSVKVGQLLVTLEATAGATGPAPSATGSTSAGRETLAKPVPPEAPGPAPSTAGAAGAESLPAGPAVRRLARELGVELQSVAGSGARGRITPDDVKAAASGGNSHGKPAPQAVPPATTPPGELGKDAWGPVRRERMAQIRRTIAAHLVQSATIIPHVTNFDDADITDLEQLRKGVPAGHLGADVKLTVMAFVMKAVAGALHHHPLLNASLDDAQEQIIYKQYVHLGVAVDTPRGLVVPVMRNVDRMTLAEIARALSVLAQRARGTQFTVEDLRGGTFTLSNLGAVGGTYSTPIINHPEVAVLLLGRSRWMPVVRGEAIEKRLLMPLSLSYDHRLVDGATAARFLNEVIDGLQSPGKLLL